MSRLSTLLITAFTLLMPTVWAAPNESATGHFSSTQAMGNGHLNKSRYYNAKTNLPSISLPALSEAQKASAPVPSTGLNPKGPERIGLWQQFDAPVLLNEMESTHGMWEYHAGTGKTWAIKIHAQGAIGMRIQLLDANLPPGTEISVYDAPTGQEYYGPFSPENFFDGEFWLPTCYNDTVILQCLVPESAQHDTLSLRIERISHIYKVPSIFQKGTAGACNNDATCFPAWANAAKGVCGIGSASFGESLFCTASLLADNDPCTDTPYILTANHCVSGATGTRGANSVECYWFFDTDSCNGTPASLASVPRTTGGSDFLAGVGGRPDTGGGNDFTLLRLRNQPPAAVYFNGWTTAAVNVGTAITGIHHPSGDFKRISFGDTVLNTVFQPQNYHQLVWGSGTTENGSSGSPLFLDATQQIIGQLWGGDAACSNPTGHDLYGRFDKTYPLIQNWVNGGPAQFSIPAMLTVVEGQQATVPISLPWASNGSGTQVDFTLTPGTAFAGQDYTFISGTRIFASGQKTRNVIIQTLENTATEPDETFTFILQTPVCAVLNPANFICTITIQDNDPDTDGDGISDADELSGAMGYVTDPNLADTDGDGLNDYQEQTNFGGYITDPTDKDTDGDGYSDLLEINFGMNPLIPDFDASIPSLSVPFFND